MKLPQTLRGGAARPWIVLGLSSVFLGSAALMRPTHAAPAEQDTAKLNRDLERSVGKLFTKYCADCHEGSDAPGGFAVDGLDSVNDVLANKDGYHKAAAMIRTSIMPPDGMPMPDRKEVLQMVEWLEAAIISNRELVDPGRVTIRRLNNFEYANTVRDLLFVEAKSTAGFPADSVGHGFDNIGDVLSLSPLLLEKLLDSAEAIAEEAIVVSSYTEEVYDAGQMTVEGAANLREDFVHFYSRGTAAVVHEFKEPGSYRVKLRAWGQQAGPEACKAAVQVGSGRPVVLTVGATRDKVGEYEFPIEIVKPAKVPIRAEFTNDYYNQQANKDRNLAIETIEILGPFGRSKNLPKSHRSIIYSNPIAGQEIQSARPQITRFASRAFRRPATSGEVDRLSLIFEAGMFLRASSTVSNSIRSQRQAQRASTLTDGSSPPDSPTSSGQPCRIRSLLIWPSQAS
jgi:hypothetical protein